MDQLNTPNNGEAPQNERKVYSTPALTDFGSITDITHGVFEGVGADNGSYS